MASPQVLSPVSPSPSLHSSFRRKVTLSNEPTPRKATFNDSQAMMEQILSPGLTSPSIFQTTFRRKDTVLTMELPHAFEPSSLRRKDTILTTELPHAFEPNTFRRKDTVLTTELPHAFEPSALRRKDTILTTELPHAFEPESFRRKDTILTTELPHAFEPSALRRKDTILTTELPHAFEPGSFRRKDTILTTELPHCFEPSAFRRKDTIFFSELPHPAVYDDRRVQKDAPHNHATDYAFHFNAHDPHAPSQFQSVIITKQNVASMLNTDASILPNLITLSKDSWRVSATTIGLIEHVWTDSKGKSKVPHLEPEEEDYFSLNLSISYALNNHGVVAEKLSLLAITGDAWDAIIARAVNTNPSALNLSTTKTKTLPSDFPFVTSEIIIGSITALKKPDFHSPFLKEGAIEIRCLSSQIPDEDEILPAGVWWLPTVSDLEVEMEDDNSSEYDGSVAGSDTGCCAGDNGCECESVYSNDTNDSNSNEASGSQERSESDDEDVGDRDDDDSYSWPDDFVYELKAALVPDEHAIVRKVVKMLSEA